MGDPSTAGARPTGSSALSGDQPLVSLVTPVYNGAAYIEECIKSVLHQTYRNWDYTVVDNASADATPDIVERYAGQDSRIRHLRLEEFVDANENHNRAYRATNAASEYCKVVQADDWLFPECLARMVEVAEGASSVGVVSAYRLAGHQIDLTGIPYSKTVIGGHEVLADSLLRRYHVTGAPSALLYRSRLVLERDSFLDTAFEHADTEAAYRVLDRNDFGFVHQVLTYARRHQPGSRMTERSDVLNTYVPENVRFLIRYGPRVLDPDTYRRQLRFELRRYLWFHLRQLPKPSRLANPEFFAVHGAEIEAILRESGGDADVRSAMLLAKTMLLRGRRMQHVETALP